MTQITLPNGSGITGSALWSQVYNNDNAIVAVINGALTNDNVSASAAIADSKLASTNNPVYKSLLQGSGLIGNDQVAATLILTGTMDMPTSGTSEAIATVTPPAAIYFSSADYAVGGLTTYLRIRALVTTNATAPAITFTFTMNPLTVAGGADALTFTAGAAVASSSVAIATPGASAATTATSSDFAVPANGAYAIAVVTSGTIANNSLVSVHAQLQVRNA